MKLGRRRSPVERPLKAGDVLQRAEPGDDFNPTEWAKFEQEFQGMVSDAEFDPMTETPYGSAMHLAEAYYVLHPKQKERMAKFIPEEAVMRDVLYSLKKGYPDIPAAFQLFFPDDSIFPLKEVYWPRMKAWIDKTNNGNSPDFYLEYVISAIRLFPQKRGELEQTAEFWLKQFESSKKYPARYLRDCGQLTLLFPSVRAYLKEYMAEHAEELRASTDFTSPDTQMKARLKMIEGEVRLKPDGTFGFPPQTQFTGPELPARPEV